jgi:hypothetical protein
LGANYATAINKAMPSSTKSQSKQIMVSNNLTAGIASNQPTPKQNSNSQMAAQLIPDRRSQSHQTQTKTNEPTNYESRPRGYSSLVVGAQMQSRERALSTNPILTGTNV